MHPLVEVSDHSCGRTPDIVSLVWHRIVGAHSAPPFALVQLVVGRVEEEVERHLEDGRDFARVDFQLEPRCDEGNHGIDVEVRAGPVVVEIAQRLDPRLVQADLLAWFTLRRLEFVVVVRFDLAAGERDLAGVAGQVGGAFGQQDRRLVVHDDWEEDGCLARRAVGKCAGITPPVEVELAAGPVDDAGWIEDLFRRLGMKRVSSPPAQGFSG